MAHKKGVGSSKNGRESAAQRLGVKIFGGEKCVAGNIIVRQRGTRHYAGQHVAMGKDNTLYALTDGVVNFKKGRRDRSTVSVLPEA
jgi:large subunit ribosomal protein L27